MEWDDLDEGQQEGLRLFFGKLMCLEWGHDELEAFVEGDDVRFRCQRCKEIQYGGQ